MDRDCKYVRRGSAAPVHKLGCPSELERVVCRSGMSNKARNTAKHCQLSEGNFLLRRWGR